MPSYRVSYCLAGWRYAPHYVGVIRDYKDRIVWQCSHEHQLAKEAKACAALQYEKLEEKT